MIGDAIERLRELPDESVHCCVTSPPYWGLRDYSRCPCARLAASDIYESSAGVSGPNTPRYSKEPKSDCPLCHGTGIIEGVKENQLGLEKTPEEYVQHLVDVFREVKRVLRDDGTLWLNLGDSYANTPVGRFNNFSTSGMFDGRDLGHIGEGSKVDKLEGSGLRQKNLIGIPWRVAFALQNDGWYLRSDIIWSKSNPMPESCSDRPTKSHEYLFFCAKSGRSLYWTHPELLGVRIRPKPDVRWVDRLTNTYYREKPSEWTKEFVECPDCEGGRLEGWFGDEVCQTCKGRVKVKRWYKKNLWRGHDYFWDQEAVREPFNFPDRTYNPDTSHHKTRALAEIGNRSTAGLHDGRTQYGNPGVGRNIRSVWEITTQPYPEAHFATFPEELPRRCIKAGTSEKGCCSECGAPYERIIERVRPENWKDDGPSTEKEKELRNISLEIYGGNQKSRSISDIFGRATKTKIQNKGWQPTCECNAEVVPCVVLDPFAGSGTTGWVARSLGRKAILIELNPVYGGLISQRSKSDVPDIMGFANSEEGYQRV